MGISSVDSSDPLDAVASSGDYAAVTVVTGYYFEWPVPNGGNLFSSFDGDCFAGIDQYGKRVEMTAEEVGEMGAIRTLRHGYVVFDRRKLGAIRYFQVNARDVLIVNGERCYLLRALANYRPDFSLFRDMRGHDAFYGPMQDIRRHHHLLYANPFEEMMVVLRGWEEEVGGPITFYSAAELEAVTLEGLFPMLRGETVDAYEKRTKELIAPQNLALVHFGFASGCEYSMVENEVSLAGQIAFFEFFRSIFFDKQKEVLNLIKDKMEFRETRALMEACKILVVYPQLTTLFFAILRRKPAVVGTFVRILDNILGCHESFKLAVKFFEERNEISDFFDERRFYTEVVAVAKEFVESFGADSQVIKSVDDVQEYYISCLMKSLRIGQSPTEASDDEMNLLSAEIGEFKYESFRGGEGKLSHEDLDRVSDWIKGTYPDDEVAAKYFSDLFLEDAGCAAAEFVTFRDSDGKIVAICKVKGDYLGTLYVEPRYRGLYNVGLLIRNAAASKVDKGIRVVHSEVYPTLKPLEYYLKNKHIIVTGIKTVNVDMGDGRTEELKLLALENRLDEEFAAKGRGFDDDVLRCRKEDFLAELEQRFAQGKVLIEVRHDKDELVALFQAA